MVILINTTDNTLPRFQMKQFTGHGLQIFLSYNRYNNSYLCGNKLDHLTEGAREYNKTLSQWPLRRGRGFLGICTRHQIKVETATQNNEDV